MKELKLKFSHDYEKLPETWQGTQARLMAVIPNKTSYIRNALTAFYNRDVTFRGEKGSYPLDFEDALILIFLHYNTGQLFSTIRRDHPAKKAYYESNIGETFTLVRSRENDSVVQN